MTRRFNLIALALTASFQSFGSAPTPEEFLRAQLQLSPVQVTGIRNGNAVAKILPSSNSSDIFVVGAVYIHAKPAERVSDSNSLLLGSGEMTLDAWINTSTIPSGNLEGPIVGKFNPAYPYQGYGLWVNGDGSGTAVFTAADCTTPSCGWPSSKFPVVSTSSVTNGQWHHVVGVRRNPGTYEIWVDGQLENSVAQSMWNTDSSNALYMGQLDGIASYWYTGLVDEVEIFNRALSVAEIQAIYNAGPAGKCK